ncbi:hypothetical protein CRENBAI_006338 [Crenichthys baileyi]|uniref:Uncharacterized protein n=1 Tax=Crenichthys baileyi TaxID=28760 RepID=A0AAV9QPD5_9TELE
MDTDAGVCTAKVTLLEAVNKRFTSAFCELLYYLSTILDPRYKDCYFDTKLRATAINELQQEVHMMTNEEDTDKAPAEEEGPGEKRHRLSAESGHSLMNIECEEPQTCPPGPGTDTEEIQAIDLQRLPQSS